MPARPLPRALAGGFVPALAIGLTCFVANTLYIATTAGGSAPAQAALYALPSSLTLVLPAACAAAAAVVFGREPLARAGQAVAWALLVGLACLVLGELVVPPANHAYVQSFGLPAAPDVTELSYGAASRLTADPHAAFKLDFRYALPLGAPALALLGAGLGRCLGPYRLPIGVLLGLLAGMGYLGMVAVAEALARYGVVSPLAAAWGPNLVAAAVGACLLWVGLRLARLQEA